MTFTDPIGDMFSRIRNGQMRSLTSVEVPSCNFRKNILEISFNRESNYFQKFEKNWKKLPNKSSHLAANQSYISKKEDENYPNNLLEACVYNF